MAGVGKFVFINYTGEPDVEDKQSLPTIRQHVMHDFFRRQREESSESTEADATPGTRSEKTMKRPRQRRINVKHSTVKRTPKAQDQNAEPNPHPSGSSNDAVFLQNNTQETSTAHENSVADDCEKSGLDFAEGPYLRSSYPAFTNHGRLSWFEEDPVSFMNRTRSTGYTDDSTSHSDENVYFSDLPSHSDDVPEGSNFPSDGTKPFFCPAIGCEKTDKDQSGLRYHKQHSHPNQQLEEHAIVISDDDKQPEICSISESRQLQEGADSDIPKTVRAPSRARPSTSDHLMSSPLGFTNAPFARQAQASEKDRQGLSDAEQLTTTLREHATTPPDSHGHEDYQPTDTSNTIRAWQPLRKEPLETDSQSDRSRKSVAILIDDAAFDDNNSAQDIGQLRGPTPLQYSLAIRDKLASSTNKEPEHEKSANPINSQRFMSLSDTDSTTSSTESTTNIDELFLDMEVSNCRDWLLRRARSGPLATFHRCFFTTDFHFLFLFFFFLLDAIFFYFILQNSTPKQTRRCANKNKPEFIPTPRLACLFNKYDPMMYRSNAQTNKKFEICGMHDFQNMNKLYEHLKRVHSDQPLQCPRCTCTSFRSPEELQAHQTASEPCNLVPLDAVKRIQWMTHDKRIALQSAISRRLRGCTDEEKWKFAYRWLFPDTNPNETPCPYLQDPVISIVSSVVDDFEIRLRELIRSSTDLNDLEGRVPMIRGQFLAQYGIRVNQAERGHQSSPDHGTVSSSSASGGGNTATPPDMAVPDQPHLEGDTDHDELTLSSNPQPKSDFLPSEHSVRQDASHDPTLMMSSEPFWFQNDLADFDNGIVSLDSNHETWNLDHVPTNDTSTSLCLTDNLKNVHAFDAPEQQGSLGYL
ncbi:hypothetical protein KCU67_g1544, partial [Aureobasidium melanogenum]